MKNFRNYLMIGLLGSGLILASCGDDDAPEVENEVEVITDVNVVFTPAGGGTVVRGLASDPDGPGTDELTVQTAPIELAAGTTYTLTFEILNGDEDVLAEDISMELDEHQVFFAWTDGLFATPTGNGNILARDTDTANTVLGDGGAVTYADTDGANPVGLQTTWITADAAATGGQFRAVLQHQPEGLKTANSNSNTGDTDFDVTFNVSIVE